MDRFRGFLIDHRRPVAAALVALAVLAGLQSVRPADDTVAMTVAARDLPSGHLMTADDVTDARVPADARPEHVLGRADAVGRRVAGPMRRGEALTDRRIVTPRRLGGDVLSTVSVEDPASVVGLRVGDRVDVVAAAEEGRAAVVVRGATVATLPRPEPGTTPAVGLTTSDDDALALAEAAVGGGLRLVVRS